MRAFEEIISYMEQKRGRNHDLEQFRQWLNKYLPAYRDLYAIQVAGTNGKGSTSRWLSLLGQEKGWKIGVFTSPHLVDHRERICIGSRWISKEDWMKIYLRYEAFFEENRFTMFEIDLWMAVAYFIQQKVDLAVFEVGLGGQRDATTALEYQATVITNIGMDHMEYLGSTLEEIAETKAGIFKPGVPALTTEDKKSCLAVFVQKAFEVNTSLKTVEPMKDLCLKALPEYQRKNVSLALETMKTLGCSFTQEQVERVISCFDWPGRFMILRQEPLIIVDGAHNVHGIEALTDSLQTWPGRIYFSALKEKEAPAMIERLLSLSKDLILVSFESERIYPLEDLPYPRITMKEMLEEIKNTEKKSLLCGSLYFIGDVLKYFGFSESGYTPS